MTPMHAGLLLLIIAAVLGFLILMKVLEMLLPIFVGIVVCLIIGFAVGLLTTRTKI